MGTRNLTKVIDKDGIVRVAQYGQWDGYPSGQGLTALYHARNAKMISDNLKKCRFVEDSEVEAILAKFPQAGYYGTEDSNNFESLYPTLTRNACADVLGYIAYATGEVLLVDQSDFEQDELFCEGVYTIDFQKSKFISWYGKTVEFDLNDLPDNQTYLNAWE